jgi:hypothetical protein
LLIFLPSFVPCYRKIQRGLVAYEKNTGKPHPLSSGIETSSAGKRDTTGSDMLTNYGNFLWFGTMSVGSPAVEFTGVALFSSV